jgi:hypothetical protein
MRHSPPYRSASPRRRTQQGNEKTKPHTPKSVWPLQRVKGFDQYYEKESTHVSPAGATATGRVSPCPSQSTNPTDRE